MERAELTELYREHGWHVERRAARILGDREAARDVCQEVFLRLVKSWKKVRRSGHPRAWLFRTTTNLCIDRLRTRKAHDPSPLDRLAAAADVERDALQREQVRRLLAHLPQRDRAIAVLRHVDGCTLEEMEEICGHTRKTISRRLERIRRTAVRLLGETWSGGDGPRRHG